MTTEKVNRLVEAAKKIKNYMDSGMLVRDISKDHLPDYYIRMAPFVMDLKEFIEALAPFEQPEKEAKAIRELCGKFAADICDCQGQCEEKNPTPPSVTEPESQQELIVHLHNHIKDLRYDDDWTEQIEKYWRITRLNP